MEKERHERLKRSEARRIELFINSSTPASMGPQPMQATVDGQSLAATLSPVSVISSCRSSIIGDPCHTVDGVHENARLGATAFITPQLAPMPQNGGVDPFQVCPVSLNNERWSMLQYFVLETLPVLSRSDMPGFFAGPVAPTQQSVSEIVRLCLSGELTTNALLTVSTARMKYVSRASFSRNDLCEVFAGTVMRMLRSRLTQDGAADESLVLAIYLLCAAEGYRRNWRAVQTHQTMIKHLYTTYLGGFRNLSYLLRRMIWFQDRFIASAQATVPIVEETCALRGVSPAVALRVLKSIEASGQSAMGTGLSNYGDYKFSPEFGQLLHELRSLACIFQCHWTGIKSSCPDQAWANGYSHIVLDKLLLFEGSRRSLEGSEVVAVLQDCVRLALITWLAFVSFPATGVDISSFKDNMKSRAAADARPLRRQLNTLFTKTEKESSMMEDPNSSMDRLVLWIVALGLLSSEVEDNREWFCARFQQKAGKLGIDFWEGFTCVGHEFLWLDRLEAVNDFRLTKLLATGQLS